MRTVYIDVYFLVNLTVDILACYFAIKVTRVRSSVARIIIIGAIGGTLAVLILALSLGFSAVFVSSLLYLILSARLVSSRSSAIRRIRFILTFVIGQIFIGGAVYFIHGALDKYRDVLFEGISDGFENRPAILFSLIILLLIGVFRLIMLLFANHASAQVANLGVTIGDIYFECEALIDSGNLVRDPMNLTPVLFIKSDLAKKYLPTNIVELSDIDMLDKGLRKRIRLIPVSFGDRTRVLTGVRADYVCLLGTGGEKIDMTVAIDKEEGSFGGYDALAPSTVINDGIQ